MNLERKYPYSMANRLGGGCNASSYTFLGHLQCVKKPTLRSRPPQANDGAFVRMMVSRQRPNSRSSGVSKKDRSNKEKRDWEEDHRFYYPVAGPMLEARSWSQASSNDDDINGLINILIGE